MDNYNEEMDLTSVTNDNDNDNVNHDNNDDDNDDMMSDDNRAIDELLPIVSLKRRSAIPDEVNDDDTTNGTATTAATAVNSVAIAGTTTCTVTARPTRTPRSITPNLFLPILVAEEEEDEHRDASAEEEGEGDRKDNDNEEVRTEEEEGNADNAAEDNGGEETETKIQTKTDASHYPAVRLFPTTKTTVVPALPSIPLPLPLLLCTPQQHKPNEEATYDDIICHYNALIQKQQRCTTQRRRSTTTPRTPNQQQYESLSYSSSSNEGTGDGKKNGVSSTTHSAQPLLLSPYFLFTPDVVSSQDEYIVPHDPPALVITNTVPIMNVKEDEDEDTDTLERQLCAQLSKIPSISKVLEEAEAVAVNPGYTDQGTTTSGVRSSSSLSFSNNKTTMTQPSSVRPLRMRRRETMTSGIFRTSITGLGGVGSNGTTAMPLLRKCSNYQTTTMTAKTSYAAPVVPSSINESW